MTRDEAKKLVMIITYTYPNWHPADLTACVDVWFEVLKEYEYNPCAMALKTFISTDTSGFAPTPGQVIGKLNIVSELSEMGEMEAWAMVRKAIGRSAYNAEEEFTKLPVKIQKAIGSAGILHAYALDDHFNETVAQSNFLRAYSTVKEREKEIAKLPTSVRNLITQTTVKMLGVSNGT